MHLPCSTLLYGETACGLASPCLPIANYATMLQNRQREADYPSASLPQWHYLIRGFLDSGQGRHGSIESLAGSDKEDSSHDLLIYLSCTSCIIQISRTYLLFVSSVLISRRLQGAVSIFISRPCSSSCDILISPPCCLTWTALTLQHAGLLERKERTCQKRKGDKRRVLPTRL